MRYHPSMRWWLAAWPVVGALFVAAACVDLGEISKDTDAVDAAGCEGAPCAPTSDDGGAGDGATAPLVDGGGGCPSGTVPVDGGACAAVCSGQTCAAHTVCGADGVTCECVTGYAKAAGGTCAFVGGPLDPGFAAQPPVWTLADDAGLTYAPTADGGGLIDDGKVSFGNVCGRGFVTQSFPMPARASAEPLALLTSARCSNCTGANAATTFHYALGTRRATLPTPTSTFTSTRTCLGERAYGGTTNLTFTRECGTIEIDHAGFVAEPKCPPPGAIAGGDFETPGTWTAAGTLAEVITAGSSTVGHLKSTTTCEVPSLVGAVANVPLTGSPAITLTQNGRGTFQLGLGATLIAELTGASVPVAARVCLPDWARGMAWPVTMVMPRRGDTGSCKARDSEFQIDDLALVDDPACAGSGYAFDTSFEGTPSGASYFWSDVPSGGGGATAATVSKAPDGARVLKLTLTNCVGGTASAFMPISIPEVPATGPGPAVRFQASCTAAGSPNTAVSFAIKSETQTLASGGLAPGPSFGPQVLCVPRAFGGRGATLELTVSSSSDCNPTLNVDQLDVGTDPSCP